MMTLEPSGHRSPSNMRRCRQCSWRLRDSSREWFSKRCHFHRQRFELRNVVWNRQTYRHTPRTPFTVTSIEASEKSAVRPEHGTKVAAVYRFNVPAGQTHVIRVRLGEGSGTPNLGNGV